MAQVSGTFSSYDAVGNKEDLIDKIFDISPIDCPIQTTIGKSKANGKFHEWQTDSLSAASSSNAQIEGDEYSYSAPSATTRVGNYCQIGRKTLIVSGTQEAVAKAGRKSELGYQAAKASKELKRDMEAAIGSNNASVAGDDTTARQSGGLRAWIDTNTDLGTSGADGGFSSGIVAAATDGTQRAFTKTIMDTVLKSCYDNGAEIKMLSVGSAQKQTFSGFMSDSNVAQLRTNVTGNGKTSIVGGVDVYVSDFGDVAVQANRFQRARDGYFIDPDYASVSMLRKLQVDKPAKTGDAQKYAVLHEWTLQVDNEAAHGVAADLS